MANVVVGAVSASLLRDGVTQEYQEYGGDRVRMESGALVSTVKGRKNIWHLVTTLLNATDAATLETAIVASPPITCSGDALGASFSCAGVLTAKERVVSLGTVWYRVHFDLMEV